MKSHLLHHRVFLLLLCVVTVGFFAILWPFLGAIFWGVVLAVLFAPLHQRLLARMPRHPTWAALATLGLCLVIVILPLVLIGASLVREAALIYESLSTGKINVGSYLQQIMAALPAWATEALDRLGLTSLNEIQDKLSSAAVQASKVIATQAVGIGQNTLGFLLTFGIMLYLLFFLLRDGVQLLRRVREALPLEPAHKAALASKFTTVVRATIKGNLMVALAQGALGGLIFWLLGIQGPVLWGVVMAFLSLLPAVGAGLIWSPVAVYFLATGDITKGAILAAYGILVIGLVDNVLRPILVGKDTKMPDYIVLISTLGGMALFGLTGFVVGPLIAALFISVWDLFSQTRHPETDLPDAAVAHTAPASAATPTARSGAKTARQPR